MPIDPYAHGKYSQGGFKGKGKGRMTSQKPSGDKKGCAVTAIALIGGVVGLMSGAGWGVAQLFN